MVFLFLLSNSFANDTFTTAVKEFTVPQLQATQLSVQGEDLFSMGGYGNTINLLDIHAGATYVLLRQNPLFTYTVANQIDATFVGEEEGVLFGFTEVANGRVEKYFGQPRGAFTYAAADLTSTKQGATNLETSLVASVGAGYGRIVDARTIAQAAAAFEVIGKSPSKQELVELAEIIGRRQQYTVQHRYEEEKFYYEAVSNAMGGLNAVDIFAVKQVLESPIYNVGSRRVGYRAGVGTESTISGLFEPVINIDDIPVKQFAGYAMLLNPNTGLLIAQELTVRNMVTSLDVATELKLSALLNTDHSSKWQSQVEGGFETTFGQQTSLIYFEGKTHYALGNRLVAMAGADIDKSFSADPFNWSLLSQITYYIF